MKKLKIIAVLLAVSLLFAGCRNTAEPTETHIPAASAPVSDPAADEGESIPADPADPEEEDPAEDRTGEPEKPDTEEVTGFEEPGAEAVCSITEFPRIDGALAAVPMIDRMTEILLDVDANTAEALTAAVLTGKNGAWTGICTGLADMAVVYDPSPETEAELTALGTALDKKAIASDALVFVTGIDNPVDSLTLQQLRDIYSGKITNWSEVGGTDADIIAYQSAEDSISQSLMKSLIMDGTEMMEPVSDSSVYAMEQGTVSAGTFDGGSTSIGYSVWYYTEKMAARDDVKMIAVDGVMPSAEYIANGSYPALTSIWAVIPQASPEGSAVRRIYEWMTSENGTDMLREEGYVPAP